jgi:hypothetical protein
VQPTIDGVSDASTQLLRGCPQCRQTMAHLVLQGHQARDVVVDHCASCRLVWFDPLESVNLSALGWIRLLRAMQGGVRAEPMAPRAAALPCPVCQSTLKPVHNATRYGRFPALECPQHHGHLHGHSGMLAERGLVRPLLGPERRALAEEKRTLLCFNCGAASDGSSEDCSYCASPLMVIDVPRLAHALRQRPGQWTDSPPPDGVPLAWSCRGCGAALDPSREAACHSCGHAVVVPSLLDLAPLLATLEHEQHAAEQAARPYRRKMPRRALTWRDTGLGMLERLWRGLGPDPQSDLRVGFALVLGLIVVGWVLLRR